MYPVGDLPGIGDAMTRMNSVLAQLRRDMKGRNTERLSYSCEEAARLLGMPSRTLAEMIGGCVVLTFELDGEKRIPASEVRRLMTGY